MHYFRISFISLLIVVVTPKYDASSDSMQNKNLNAEHAGKVQRAKEYLQNLDDSDRDAWINPYDMFNYDQSSINRFEDTENTKKYSQPVSHISVKTSTESQREENTLAKSTHQKEETDVDREVFGCSNKNVCVIFLLRWLKKFLLKMKYSDDMQYDEIRTFKFDITNHDLQSITNIINSESPNIQDIESLVSNFVSDARVVVESRSFDLGINFNFLFGTEVLLFVFITSTVVLIVFTLRCLSNHPTKTTMCLIVIISVCWQWMHLYKKKIAQQHATLEQSDYPACKKDDFGLMKYAFYYFKSFFTSENSCEKYYKALMVDPFWEVTPALAISEAMASTFFQPLESAARIINISAKELISGLSMFAVVSVILFVFLLLIMLCQYRIKFPFFLGALEPAPRNLYINNKVEELATDDQISNKLIKSSVVEKVTEILCEDKQAGPPCNKCQQNIKTCCLSKPVTNSNILPESSPVNISTFSCPYESEKHDGTLKNELLKNDVEEILDENLLSVTNVSVCDRELQLNKCTCFSHS